MVSEFNAIYEAAFSRALSREDVFGLLQRNDRGYVFDGERFSSFQEVQCYRYLYFIGLRSHDINHEFKVGNSSYDFFPLRSIFWEHHPIGPKYGEDIYQYAKKRRLILNENGYGDFPLVVTDSMFGDPWEVCDLMNLHDVDFRYGSVVGSNSGITCIHDYSKEYASHPTLACDAVFS